MLYTYDQRFDMTKNLKNFCELLTAWFSARGAESTYAGGETPHAGSLVEEVPALCFLC